MTTPRPRLAYHHTPGTGPTIVFLPGYASDMTGPRRWRWRPGRRRRAARSCASIMAAAAQSEGEFAEQTLAGWRDDVAGDDRRAGRGPGGAGRIVDGRVADAAGRARAARAGRRRWSASRRRPTSPTGASPPTRRCSCCSDGRLERANPYGPEPTVYTRALLVVGRGEPADVRARSRSTAGAAAAGAGATATCRGTRTARLAELIRSADVQTLAGQGRRPPPVARDRYRAARSARSRM